MTKLHHRVFVVDAMSSFGGMPIDLEACGIDFLISSANNCLEGVLGFSIVFARHDMLLASAGRERSLSLDLLDQFKGLQKNGQFRYTPPPRVLLAFDQALRGLETEGGIAVRLQSYWQNQHTLVLGIRRLGLQVYLEPEVQSPFITRFHYPDHPCFDFPESYRRVADRGFILYPGKLSQCPAFRIGNIGRLFETEMEQVVHAIA